MRKNMVKSLDKNLSSNCGQKLLDTTKHLATNALKIASNMAIPKNAAATGDLVGNKIAEKITKATSRSTCKDLKKSTQIPEPTSIPKEIYIPPEKQQHIIDELRLL